MNYTWDYLRFINDSCHVNGLVKTVSNTEAAKTRLQLGDELVKDSGLDQELGSGRADLALVEPDGVHDTLDGRVQVSRVKHDHRGLAAQLQGDLLAGTRSGNPQYLANLG
mgnify:CR=1 FL=1